MADSQTDITLDNTLYSNSCFARVKLDGSSYNLDEVLANETLRSQYISCALRAFKNEKGARSGSEYLDPEEIFCKRAANAALSSDKKVIQKLEQLAVNGVEPKHRQEATAALAHISRRSEQFAKTMPGPQILSKPELPPRSVLRH